MNSAPAFLSLSCGLALRLWSANPRSAVAVDQLRFDQYVGMNTPFIQTPQCCQPWSHTCG